jgi:predicted RNA-binding Zn ribbon-like protein
MARISEKNTNTVLASRLGDKPAPPQLQPVQALVNTLDLDEGTDLLEDVDSARDWLREAGFLGTKGTLNRAQWSEVREVRESLRALLAHNSGAPMPTPEALKPLRTLAASRQPKLGIDGSGNLEFEPPPGSDVRDVLLRLLVAVRDSQADGTWSRLKVCRNTECLWAFYDRSRNHQGAWCDMASCGNRLKNRAFRARKR